MKSEATNLFNLWSSIYKDALTQCRGIAPDPRDINYVKSRVEQEGVSFLTITLPEFCKDFEKALQNSWIEPGAFRSFRKTLSIPSFLKGMMSTLFDGQSGRLIEHERNREDSYDCSTIVNSIRQICLAFKKVEIDCTPNRVNKAIKSYVQIEHELSSFVPSDADIDKFSTLSNILWPSVISSIRVSELSPHHGPGATADYISGNRKYNWRSWHDRLETYFPFLGNAISLSAYDDRVFQDLEYISEEQEKPVRVVPVPKTLKGPRIIAIEPVCMQYIQQGIKDALYRNIQSCDITKGHVNFTDQSVNQSIALSSSKDGAFATIDLSEASDRVPLSLVSKMFDCHPDLWGAILSCRSHSASLPNGEVIHGLRKFASMGSALCFPIESMYFYTICVAALLDNANLPYTYRNAHKVSRDVFIYGDDIIVPRKDALSVLCYLQKYNCKVNTSKTFLNGKFRESCGVDAYDGEVVTPTYVRKLPPLNRRDSSSIISWVKTANLFYKRGFWSTCDYMFKHVEKILGYALPYVSDDSPGLGRQSFLGYRTIERWNKTLQRFEVKTLVACPVFRQDKLTGYPALQKFFELGSHNENIDKKHLERSALHGAVTLKLRWVPAL